MTKLVIFSGLLTLVAIPILIFSAVTIFSAVQEAKFTAVKGMVLSSSVKEYEHKMSGERTGTVSWRLFVEYRYQFAGQSYTNDKVSIDMPLSQSAFNKPPSQKLQLLLEGFEPGSRVTVYVKPSDPTKAVLIRSSKYKGILWLAFGVIILIVSQILKRI